MDQKKIGAFIAEMRKARQLTQHDLADIIGISDKTVSRWETDMYPLYWTPSKEGIFMRYS